MMPWRYGAQATPPAGSDGNFGYGHPMMGFTGAGGAWAFSIIWLITWLLVVAVLIALVRWLWKKGDSNKKEVKNAQS